MSKVSVAVLGLNGALGAPTIEAFENPIFKDKIAFPVLALTRDPSSKQSTETIKYVAADITGNKEDTIKQLKGIDVIVSLLHPTPDILAAIEEILTQIKPKLYIPSQFGCDLAEADKVLPTFLALKTNHSKKVREAGIKVVNIVTSFFAGGPWLYEIVGHLGVDAESKTVTYLGAPETPLSFTNLKDVGRVVVSVASKAKKDIPDTIRVQSGKITQETVIKRYEESHNVKLTVKETISKEEVLKQAQADWNGTDYSKFLYWLNVIVSQGEGSGAAFSTTQNELVNPGESLWKWEKY